jgi:hypothetical protein
MLYPIELRVHPLEKQRAVRFHGIRENFKGFLAFFAPDEISHPVYRSASPPDGVINV